MLLMYLFFVTYALVFVKFSLPIGVGVWVRFVIVGLPGSLYNFFLPDFKYMR